MKVLAAVGSDGDSFEAGTLLGRLKFKELGGTAVYVVERVGPALVSDNVASAADLITRFMQLQEEEGRTRLASASEHLQRCGVRLETQLRTGFIANEILKAADEQKVDLIALGSRDESPLAKLLVGSVTRKIVAKASQSLLVARNLKRQSGDLHAVLATDHSSYGDRCFEMLLSDWPSGITDVTIVTAYPREVVKAIGAVMANIKTDFDAMVGRVLTERNGVLQAKLESKGVRVKTVVSPDRVDDAIDRALRDTGAELLILGAQGHGFLERLGVGSVSFEQVVGGKTSVLVLRA